MNSLLTPKRLAWLVAALGVVVVVISGVVTITPRHEHFMMGGSSPAVSVTELLERADAVAVVRPSSLIGQHWNNAANRKWTSDSAARMALIVTDQIVEVAELIKGDLPQAVTVRLPGGTVGDTTFDSALKPLEPGQEYLLFLDWTDTPTEEGSEPAWTIYMGPVGKFERNDAGVWANHLEANTIKAVEVLRAR